MCDVACEVWENMGGFPGEEAWSRSVVGAQRMLGIPVEPQGMNRHLLGTEYEGWGTL